MPSTPLALSPSPPSTDGVEILAKLSEAERQLRVVLERLDVLMANDARRRESTVENAEAPNTSPLPTQSSTASDATESATSSSARWLVVEASTPPAAFTPPAEELSSTSTLF